MPTNCRSPAPHAGVSRRTFYEQLSDCEDCLNAAVEEALAHARARALAAYDPGEPWRARIRAALGELLAFFDEQPATARLLVVETLGAGPDMLARRARGCSGRRLAHPTRSVDMFVASPHLSHHSGSSCSASQ